MKVQSTSNGGNCISEPLAGRDRRPCSWRSSCRNFNPRAPCGARHNRMIMRTKRLNFNPRAPCGARPAAIRRYEPAGIISTHAPHAGRDRASHGYANIQDPFQPTRPMRGATRHSRRLSSLIGISTHAPHAGRDAEPTGHPIFSTHFNPRAPCGARPSRRRLRPIPIPYFNPRAPCGARLISHFAHLFLFNFNPRAPCGARLGLSAPRILE